MNWLSERQLIALTRRRQGAAQIRVLRESGIPFRVVDGRPIVLAADVALELLEKRCGRLGSRRAAWGESKA